MKSVRSLTLIQAQQLAGTLTVLAAFAAGAVSGELGTAFCGLFLAALLGAVLVRARFAHKHDAVWTVLLFGALIVLLLQVVTGALDVVLGAARFALLLCAHRLWNRANERDELLLLLLSLLLLCAGAALSAELLFGFAFALYAVSGTWALALTHLRFRIEESRAESAQAMLHSRRLITPQMFAALGGLSLIALAGAVSLFFVFPRVTIGGLHRLAHGRKPVAGLTDQIELGGHGAIADDPQVALRVRFAPQDDDGSAELALHWRARSLEVWTGHGWRARPSAAKPEMPRPPRKKLLSHTTDMELLAAFSEGVLLVPEGLPIFVHFPEPVSARPSSKQSLFNGAGDLLYQPIEVGDLRYQVTTLSSTGGERDRPARADPSAQMPQEAALDMEVPLDLDPKVLALGEKLTTGKDPRSAAQSVLEYLSVRQGFRYTRVLEDGGRDPIADFLFRRKAGHCELFSSAMVLLLRAGGIPARNVTGYYGGVRMPGGYYAVRAGDAHSWVEVWQADEGWVLWDPTPAGERGSHQEGLWARAVLLWDSVQARWLSTVVEFDLLSQARAVTQAARIFQEAGRRLSGRGTGPSQKLSLKRVGLLAGGALLIVAAVVFWRTRRQRKESPGAKLQPDQIRAQSLWKKARSMLERAGVELPPSMPPREAAQRAGEIFSRTSRVLAQLVDRYSQARWGGRGLAASEARALLSRLQKALQETA